MSSPLVFCKFGDNSPVRGKTPYMKIITVSYRLPLSIKKTKGKAKITQSAGGLATAILSYSAKSNVNLTWVGIADFDSITWNENKDKYDQNFDIEPVFFRRRTQSGVL